MNKETENLHIRFSSKGAESLRKAVRKCGRGMSQGLFLERCFEMAHRHVVAAATKADAELAMAALDKEPK
jgi:DNA-directed RNA polymerase beta' subunit